MSARRCKPDDYAVPRAGLRARPGGSKPGGAAPAGAISTRSSARRIKPDESSLENELNNGNQTTRRGARQLPRA
ncbi:hypothetical protein, partial [Burkholderia gladioli]|uniref:hypothetical protein n=1 Tax=Burkholderia gladioli TaxID=28095 RepID=UPI001C21E2B5